MTLAGATAEIEDMRATIRQVVERAEAARGVLPIPFIQGIMLGANVTTLRQIEEELGYRAREVERCGERAQGAIAEIVRTLGERGKP